MSARIRDLEEAEAMIGRVKGVMGSGPILVGRTIADGGVS